MRLVALAFALLLAGCATTEDGGSTTTTSTPVTTTPASGDATFEPVHLRHDYSGPASNATFTIPVAPNARYAVLVAFEGPAGAPLCAGTAARILVTAPDGSAYADHTVDGPGVPTGPDGRCGSGTYHSGDSLAPGTYAVEFTGSGQATGLVDVTLAS